MPALLGDEDRHFARHLHAALRQSTIGHTSKRESANVAKSAPRFFIFFTIVINIAIGI